MNAKQASLDAIARVAVGLQSLNSEVTFVGGATSCLYIDDPAVGDVRPTEDVDCVVELAGMVK